MSIAEKRCTRCPCCACNCDACAAKAAYVPPVIHGTVKVVNEFRDDAPKQEQRSLVLEALLMTLPTLDGLERWEIESRSYQYTIVGVIRGKKLHEFTSYVRQLAQVLGPPNDFQFDTVYEDRTPDFKARWVVRTKAVGAYGDHPQVHLRSERPECKLDPRTKYAAPKQVGSWEQPKLHPECLAALEALKDEIENDFSADGMYKTTVNGQGREFTPAIEAGIEARQ